MENKKFRTTISTEGYYINDSKGDKRKLSSDDISDSENLVKITYDKLKALKNNGELRPGRFYRITDYQCTTCLENTQAANHLFDIVVKALSETELDENAKAMHHEFTDYNALKCKIGEIDAGTYVFKESRLINGSYFYIYEIDLSYIVVNDKTNPTKMNILSTYDSASYTVMLPEGKTSNSIELLTLSDVANALGCQEITLTPCIIGSTYFDNSDLSKWELKYKVEGTIGEFAWADCAKKTSNYINYCGYCDCEYIGTTQTKDGVILYCYQYDNNYIYSNKPDNSYTIITDMLIVTPEEMKTYQTSYTSFIRLDDANELLWSAFKEHLVVNNYVKHDNTKGIIYYMKDEFGNECPYDFKNIIYEIKYPSTTHLMYTFGDEDRISSDRSLNSIGMESLIYDNTILPYVKNGVLTLNWIYFYRYAVGNKIGRNCYNITDDDNGRGLYYNTIRNNCHDIYLDDYCFGNEFDYGCNNISIDDYCSYNKFESYCNNIKLNKDYASHNTIHSKTKYVKLTTSGSTSASNELRNIEVYSTASGTSDSTKTITVEAANVASPTSIIYK